MRISADDLERIHESGKLVAAIGIENSYVIGKDLSLLGGALRRCLMFPRKVANPAYRPQGKRGR